MAAAVMNIHLPIYLGEIINVMTRFMGSESRGSFSSQMQGPVLNVMGLYLSQVCTLHVANKSHHDYVMPTFTD